MTKEDFELLYNKNYDYEDMKLAIFVENFYNHKQYEIDKDDLCDFCGYENTIKLALEIRDAWQQERNFGTLADNEYGYIQEFALRYLTQKYLK